MSSSTETELSLILRAKNLASKEVDRLHKSLGGIGKVAGNAGGSLLHLGKQAALLAGGALLGIVGGLFAAGKAAADEEKGIAKLNAALKASDKSFKGNTDSIEAAIKTRERLAFSDDDLRSSLSFLVTKTHDSKRALALQTTAMDLARLKGISLDEASQMLTKGLDGNQKILKQLGITLPKTATEQERLTAIQKAAAGQADAYSKTASGGFEGFQIVLGDLVEDIGGFVLPMLTALGVFLRDTVVPVVSQQVVPAIKGAIAAVTDWATQNKPLIDQIVGFVGGALSVIGHVIGDIVVPAISAVVDAVSKWVGANQPLIQGVGDFLAHAIQTIIDVLKVVIPIVMKVAQTVMPILGKAVGVVGDVIVASFKVIQGVWNTLWTVATAVTGGIGKAWQGLTGVIKTVWDGIIGIAKGAANFMIGIVNGIIRAIDGIQIHIGRIGLDTPAGFIGVGPFNWNGLQLKQIPYLAAGGIATGPTTAMIGERGPEAVLPLDSSAGRKALAGLGGGGGTPVELVLQIDGREISRLIDKRLYLSFNGAGGSSRPR